MKLANRQLWLDIKTQRASIAAGGSTIAENFGSPWDVSSHPPCALFRMHA